MINKKRAQRLTYIFILLAGIALAISLILYSLKQNINLFFTPTEALAAAIPLDRHFRLGGQVKPGSMIRKKNSLDVHFVLTDLNQEIPIEYTGILPDLFREGNGAIAEGQWRSDRHAFVATQILAKHDEKYMPRQLKSTIH